MEVRRASSMGMCFGVRGALETARSIEDPTAVSIHGELVHNGHVNRELTARGFDAVSESERETLSSRPLVLITAHGVSDGERERLRAGGKELVDTTCPLVRHVHATALALQADGYFVVVIGRRGHVEVEGLVGDLRDHEVVPTPEAARAIPSARIGVVCQTTMPPARTQEILERIAERNPDAELKFVDTTCGPTRYRQEAMEELVGEVEAVVVVGGERSNNTRALARLVESHGKPVLHVQEAADLDREWLERFQVVGLTAGTSTLDETIAEVHEVLTAI